MRTPQQLKADIDLQVREKFYIETVKTEDLNDILQDLTDIAASGGAGGGGATGSAGGDLTGSYPNPVIGTDKVTTAKIADANVTTPKIADGGVTTAKVADGAITAAKMEAGLLPTALPPTGAAGGDLGGTYPNPTIGAGKVTAAKIADGNVTTVKIADLAVTAGKIQDGAIDTVKIVDNAISTPKIQDGAVTNGKIANAAVTADKIDNNAVDNQRLANNSVSAGKIIDGNVTTAKLADNAVTTAKLGDNAVSSAKIQSSAINAGKIAPNAVEVQHIMNGAVGADKIAANAISTAKIQNGAIVAEKIQSEAVTGEKFSLQSVGQVGDIFAITQDPNTGQFSWGINGHSRGSQWAKENVDITRLLGFAAGYTGSFQNGNGDWQNNVQWWEIWDNNPQGVNQIDPNDANNGIPLGGLMLYKGEGYTEIYRHNFGWESIAYTRTRTSPRNFEFLEGLRDRGFQYDPSYSVPNAVAQIFQMLKDAWNQRYQNYQRDDDMLIRLKRFFNDTRRICEFYIGNYDYVNISNNPPTGYDFDDFNSISFFGNVAQWDSWSKEAKNGIWYLTKEVLFRLNEHLETWTHERFIDQLPPLGSQEEQNMRSAIFGSFDTVISALS